MKVIIAEKPSVARDIALIVGAKERKDGYMEGNGYTVTWGFGHLVGLAMPEAYGFEGFRRENLPIFPERFQLVPRQVKDGKQYKDDPGAVKQLAVIRSLFDKSESIIVATDAGREGELIFRYIYHYLGCTKPFSRLWISSLTDKAIRQGMDNLKDGREYDNLYRSAKARSEADWLVGINASQALCLSAGRGVFSLGRVQTPTLMMICNRYMENKNFTPQKYWQLRVQSGTGSITFSALSAAKYDRQDEAAAHLQQIQSSGTLQVTAAEKKEASQEPPLLYDLTALQKEANVRHGFSADKTLSIAQSLYEKKVTSYPRHPYQHGHTALPAARPARRPGQPSQSHRTGRCQRQRPQTHRQKARRDRGQIPYPRHIPAHRQALRLRPFSKDRSQHERRLRLHRKPLLRPWRRQHPVQLQRRQTGKRPQHCRPDVPPHLRNRSPSSGEIPKRSGTDFQGHPHPSGSRQRNMEKGRPAQTAQIRPCRP